MGMKKPTRFYVHYNGCFIADYKSVRACLNFIRRNGLENDCDNSLHVVDNNGDMYNCINGNKIKV